MKQQQSWSLTELPPEPRSQLPFIVSDGRTSVTLTFSSGGVIRIWGDQGDVRTRLLPWIQKEHPKYIDINKLSPDTGWFQFFKNLSASVNPSRKSISSKQDDNDQEQWRIIQIIPAQPGWQAVYASGSEPPAREDRFSTRSIVCWALVVTSAGTEVVAMEIVEPEIGSQPQAETRFVINEQNGFIGYTYPGCNVDWDRVAHEQREEAWDKKQEYWKF